MRNKPRWPLMKRRLYIILRYILIYTATLIIALPIIWIIVMSVKTKDQIFNTSFIPNPITFDHYWWVLTETPFLNSLKNSFILAAAVTLISVILGSLAAYSISNFRYTGRLLFSRLVLFSYLVPAILLIVPIYLTLSSLGLINKLSGLGIAHLAFILPFCLTL